MKSINIFLVALLVLVSINPCAAFATDGGDPAPGQREPKMLPAVAVGGYVITNTELIALLVGSFGGVVGYATISPDKHGFDDVLHHLDEFEERISDFFHETIDNILHFGSHDVGVYRPNTPGFSLIEQRYNTAKAAKDSYEDSKRKGIPVPGEGNNKGEVRHDVDPSWNKPLSSYQLFHNDVDRRNGCPKQIRYFNEKGERDLDIDFYHRKATDETTGLPVTFPHKHIWWSNGQRGDHLYDGLDEIIRNWKCKNYDFENSRWR